MILTSALEFIIYFKYAVTRMALLRNLVFFVIGKSKTSSISSLTELANEEVGLGDTLSQIDELMGSV